MFKPVIKSNGSSHSSALLDAYLKSQQQAQQQQQQQMPTSRLSPNLPNLNKRERPIETIKSGIDMGKFLFCIPAIYTYFTYLIFLNSELM